MSEQSSTPRIEYLRIKNYRVLHNLELKGLTPFTVFLGPNGSGKSTIFDVFAFLSECFTIGLRRAWDKRNRFKELLTRGGQGNIEIEMKFRETRGQPIITYHLSIGENGKGPYIAEEWLQWRRKGQGKPFKFLDFKEGVGHVISGESPDENQERISETLESPEMLAVNTLGQFSKHPRVSALRKFVSGWYLSYLSAEHTRGVPEAGPQERLSQTGDNLPNVVQYLRENHQQIWEKIIRILKTRIPHLKTIEAEMLNDGRLLLQIIDAPFERPILAKFASDGTLKLLAYLLVLYDPEPAPFIGIEEPENHLHPRLLPELAEECRLSTERTQLLVTSHSPYFVNHIRPEELWVLYRDDNGFTQAKNASLIQGVREFLDEGALLGQLWMEGHFRIGDPLTSIGKSLYIDQDRSQEK